MAPSALEEAIDWVASFERLNATEAPPYAHGKALIREIEELRDAVGTLWKHLHNERPDITHELWEENPSLKEVIQRAIA